MTVTRTAMAIERTLSQSSSLVMSSSAVCVGSSDMSTWQYSHSDIVYILINMATTLSNLVKADS